MGQGYSNGTRTGRITKISKRGCIFKTWECEMVSDGLKTKYVGNGMSTAVANTWDFSVDADRGHNENIDAIVKRLQTKLENGDPVTVIYWSPYVPLWCRGESVYYVYDVK
jgi:hypothetical protein